MRIFLTGATGYIGLALARRLAERGHELTAVVRERDANREAREALEGLGVACHPGDVTDRYSLRVPMSGADRAVHLAAVIDPGSPAERLEAVNVDGSEAVASLAWKLGVGRLVSVSSMAVFGGSPPDGSPADEGGAWYDAPTPYAATKRRGLQAIDGWAKRGLAVDTVYPSLVYGPPGKDRGTNELLAGLLSGRFPVLVGADRKASWVYLDDVVDALITVIETVPGAGDEAAAPGAPGAPGVPGAPGALGVPGARGAGRAAEAAGRRYLLAGEVATVGEVAARVAAWAGAEPPSRSLSPKTAQWAVRLAGPLLRLAGKEVPVSAQELTVLERHWAFDDSRARRQLGWHPRPLSEGLPPTLEHLSAQLGARRGSGPGG